MKSNILQLIKDITRPTRLYFRLHNKWTRPLFGRYFGLLSLDQEIERYVSKKKGFFVELGANDGISQSNTKYFELFKSWKGVLIEPYEPNYKKCIKNRKKTTIVFHAACVPFSYSSTSIEMIYSNLMTITASNTNEISDQMGHAVEGSKFLDVNEQVHNFVAPARTLQSILDQAKAPKVMDLLSLDVEGYELEVLNGLDHEKYRFKFICVESRPDNRMQEFMSAREYDLVTRFKTGDLLFTCTRQN